MTGATRMLAVTVIGLTLVLIAGGLAVAGSRPNPVAVPQLQSLSAAAATARLQHEGLRIEAVAFTGPTSRPVDTVLRQNPQLGAKLMPGSTVRVDVVSPQIAVPNLLGGQIDHLHATLDARRLTPQVGVVGSVKPSGQVLTQIPAPGALLPRAGAVVRLQVASGPA
jgi:beta-lactam-binding protein with PASTA domain